MHETPLTSPVPHVIDARVRLPSPLRAGLRDAGTVYDDYDAALAVGERWTLGLGRLRSDMDEAGVAHAIVHAEYEQGDVADAFNDELGRLVAEDPSRFSGFGTVSLERLDPMRAVRQVQRVADLGLSGINVQPSFFGLALDDRLMYPVYAKATELGLAIALHTGVNYSRSAPIEAERPVRLDQIACDFRDATLVACHGGWPWVPEIVAVARRHPNVLIDFGGLAPKYVGMAGSGWELMRHFMDRGLRDQVLFATDWPVFPHARALEEWRGLGLRDATWTALLGGNAQRLLAGGTAGDPGLASVAGGQAAG